MATRKRSGLDDVQLSTLRTLLSTGKTPRVGVTGPQFPDGTHGTIVRIGDPAADGTDFITVRVKVDRVVDELQFAPSELTSSVAGAKPAPTAPRTGRSRRTGPSTAAAKVARPVAKASPSARTPAAAASAAKSTPTASAKPSAATAAKRRTGQAKPVTITITSSGSDWSVAVQRGSRTVLRPQPITPGSVSAIGKLVNNAELTEAIADINDAARADAEERAARLRAELNAVEAVLATHKTPR